MTNFSSPVIPAPRTEAWVMVAMSVFSLNLLDRPKRRLPVWELRPRDTLMALVCAVSAPLVVDQKSNGFAALCRR